MQLGLHGDFTDNRPRAVRCVHPLVTLLEKLDALSRRYSRVMPFQRIEEVVSDALPHGLREIIPSTMGEPLLYEHFEDIVALCQRTGVKLNLTTNGTFPRLGPRAWAEPVSVHNLLSAMAPRGTCVEPVVGKGGWALVLTAPPAIEGQELVDPGEAFDEEGNETGAAGTPVAWTVVRD